jgi:hypothetical protein
MPEDIYRKSWSRHFRGLLIFLLDQSGSMQEPVQLGGKSYTNGQVATTALNDLIHSVTNNTSIDPETGQLKDSCDIIVMGYGDRVTTLLDDGRGAPISISKLAAKPKGYNRVLVGRSIQGKIQQVEEMHPYWVEYTAGSRYTEMAKALQSAYQVIVNWLRADPKHSLSFPPIIVNITDGEHNGEGDPAREAAKVRELYTHDGHALLFSCHLTSHGQQRIVFPKTQQIINAQIANVDERDWAIQLFNMSSLIPRTMVRKARETYSVGLEDGVRGFIYNAGPSDLVNFLRWGTQPK